MNRAQHDYKGSIAPIPDPVHLTPCGVGCLGSSSARLFACSRCSSQVLICRRCDRGHVYCRDCAQVVRREAMRDAGRRYQMTRRGRMMHAQRARRQRARQKIVTHHGSLPKPPDDQVVKRPAAASIKSPSLRSSSLGRPPWRCHFCGDICPEFVRQGFLKRRGPRRYTSPRGAFPDGHPP